MARIDGIFEAVLALAGLGLIANVAFSVLVWVYALVAVRGSLVAGLVGLFFIVFGTAIVVGFVQVYLAFVRERVGAESGRHRA